MSNIIDSIQLSGAVYTIQGTVSSAITSGDTNAVAGGAVYDKFDEVEQVTARALIDLDERKQGTLSAGTGIQISGNVISATGGGGGNPTVELTQAEYDDLVSAGTVSADTYYIITDATPVDMGNYWTSAQTNSAINQATSGKANTSDVYTKSEVDDAITAATYDKIYSISFDGIEYGHINLMYFNDDVHYEHLFNVGEGLSMVHDSEGEYKLVATGGSASYSAGTGILISGDVISAVYPVVSLGNEEEYLENQSNPFYVKLADYCEDTTENEALIYFTDYSFYLDCDYDQHTFRVSQGYENYFSVSWDDAYGMFLVTPIQTLQGVYDNGCARFIPVLSIVNKSTTKAINEIKEDVDGIKEDIDEIEEVTSRALIDLQNNKLDASAYTPTDLSNYYTSAQTDSAIAQAVSGKQDTLSAGTNITISGNVISAEGGGKAISAGTNISVTTGATADTINCTLPFSHNTSPKRIVGNSQYSLLIGKNNNASTYAQNSLVVGENSSISNGGNINCAVAIGYASTANTSYSTAVGSYVKTNNSNELSTGKYNVSNTGSTTADKTLFSVGNGTADNARHNAFEIRQNGDIYCNNGTSDVKLQDYIQIKVMKLTQQEYDALTTKDSNTLYVIVN